MALLVPLAMAVGQRVGVSPFLTALMVANGANAGNLSPFSSVGIIANGAMAKAGLVGHEARVWFANFAAHVLVAGVAYVWLSRRAAPGAPSAAAQATTLTTVAPLTPHQQLTLAVITAWILGVVALNMNLGLSAFAAAAISARRSGRRRRGAVRGVPWGIIMMVCGVSVLIAVLETDRRHGPLHVAARPSASPSSINGVIAFVTGAISTYSSTSGVVLPAFLPTIPSLVDAARRGRPPGDRAVD